MRESVSSWLREESQVYGLSAGDLEHPAKMPGAVSSMDPAGAAVKKIGVRPLAPPLLLTRAKLLVAHAEFAHARQIVG